MIANLKHVQMTENQQNIADHYLNLAKVYASEYKGKPYYEDLLQEIRMSICYSVATYKENEKCKLSTYIINAIKYTLGHFLKKYYYSVDSEKNMLRCSACEDEEDNTLCIQSVADIKNDIENYTNKYLIKEVIPEKIRDVFSESRRNKKQKDLYLKYIQYLLCGQGVGVQTKLAKDYGVSRQFVNQIINEYNTSLRNKLGDVL